MSNIDNRLAELRELERRAHERDALHGGGGGGTSDSMEPRIAKLEAHMENVRAELTKLSAIPERLRAVEVRVDHLPSKGFIVGVSVTTIGLLTSVIVFADKLRALIG